MLCSALLCSPGSAAVRRALLSTLLDLARELDQRVSCFPKEAFALAWDHCGLAIVPTELDLLMKRFDVEGKGAINLVSLVEPLAPIWTLYP